MKTMLMEHGVDVFLDAETLLPARRSLGECPMGRFDALA
jgi:hypothetical protein